MNPDFIGQAARNLVLRDIILFDCAFSRGGDVPDSVQIVAQNRHGTTHRLITTDGETILRSRVAAGLRLFESSDSPYFAEIVADFLLIHTLKEKVSDEAIEAFVERNCPHLIWPFWRQHVYDIINRARLPHIEIPMLFIPPMVEQRVERRDQLR